MGATSAIAEASARLMAQRGDSLFLVGRDAQRLGAIAADLKLRGADRVFTHVLDARDLPGYAAMLQAANEQLGGLDAALIAHGTLSDQSACQNSTDRLLQELSTNAL